MRQQYHFRQSGDQLLIWDVNRLIERASQLPVRAVRLDTLSEVDQPYWYELGGAQPTCRNITEHAKLIAEADLAYPIILCHQGRVMDGMHRICKALMLGHGTINAVQFPAAVAPDYIDCDPDQLPY